MRDIDPTLFWISTFLAVVVLSLVFMFYRDGVEEKARNARRSAYLVNHKCVTVSYAGKNAEPVYQCNNGLVMWKQIP